MILVLTIVIVAALAFANGANDVSKGIATLAGSGRASYRQALVWGALWTGVGALAAVVISFGLVRAFTSALVAPDLLAAPAFPLAVAAGATSWVLVASATGLPVSTTHAITGALVGTALAGGGSDSVQWWLLTSTIAAPLILSPLASAVIGYAVHGVIARTSPACVCVDETLAVRALQPDGSAIAVPANRWRVSAAGCADAPGRTRLTTGALTHWAAAASLSFARGVNDNPKIAALGVLAFASLGSGPAVTFLVTALAMTLGSVLAGFRVSRTLGERVVHMYPDTGVASAVVAAGLVLAASFYTLPVSTTHVATGAIVGAGVRQGVRAVQWPMVGSLAAAWVITLPVAALLGAVASGVLRLVF